MKSARRDFLKETAFAGATCLIGTPKFQLSSHPSVVVVGAGAFGGWAALQLVEKGAKVTLLDASGPGNSRASSGGETRTIRATYGPTPALYVRMVARALQLWQEYERRWKLRLFFRSGALRMAGADDSYERAALPILTHAGIPFERPSPGECSKRWRHNLMRLRKRELQKKRLAGVSCQSSSRSFNVCGH
jgi:sarcosine oxidase